MGERGKREAYENETVMGMVGTVELSRAVVVAVVVVIIGFEIESQQCVVRKKQF